MSRKSCQMIEIRRGVETGTCREPATVKWEWGESDPLYVCDHHDEEIQGDKWGERTELACHDG